MRFALLIPISLLIGACAPRTGPSILPNSPVAAPNDVGFLPQNAEKGALFQYYQPKARSKWRNNWTSRFDLTGVSWNDARAATLISPSHVVMAAHFMRPSDVAVMFHDKNGNLYERYITAVRTLAVGDIAVGRLNLPLPPAVKYYRLANAGDAGVGRTVIVTDQTSTLSVHRIAAVSGATVSLGHIPALSPIYRRNLVVGDSGHPSFVIKNGELVLLETHTSGGAGAGPFYGDPGVQAAIRAAMAGLGN